MQANALHLVHNIFRHILRMIGNTLQIVYDLNKYNARSRNTLAPGQTFDVSLLLLVAKRIHQIFAGADLSRNRYSDRKSVV